MLKKRASRSLVSYPKPLCGIKWLIIFACTFCDKKTLLENMRHMAQIFEPLLSNILDYKQA